MNQYLQNGWEGLSPEAQNAINQLKTMQTDWNDILFIQVSQVNELC